MAWSIAQASLGKFEMIQLKRTGKGCLSYFVASNNEALIVDASLPVEVYEQVLTQFNLTLKCVIEIHIHADHQSTTFFVDEKVLLLPLLLLNEKEFAKALLQRIPLTSANYLSIVEKNLKGDLAGINPVDLEGGANRCAIS